MKVNAWKNIDIEVEVDVSVEDVVHELGDIANSDDGWRRKLSAIDGASKVLELIGVEPLDNISGNRSSIAKALRDRLLPIVLWSERELMEACEHERLSKHSGDGK